MKRFILFLVLFVCMLLLLYKCSNVETRDSEVFGTVTDMQYKDSYSSWNAATKTPQYHPKEYLVTITYEGITQTFNSKSLYETVNEGDSVCVILHEYIYIDLGIAEQTLVLPQQSYSLD